MQILAHSGTSEVSFDSNDPLEGKIQDFNLRRFKPLSEEGFEITKDIEDSLDLYEYLFGLGKVLCDVGQGILAY